MRGFLESYIRLLKETFAPAFLIDPAGLIVFWNGPAVEFTGLDPSMVEGTVWWETVINCKVPESEGETPDLECPVRNCSGKTQTQSALCRIRTTWGKDLGITLRVIPLGELKEESCHAAVLFQPADRKDHGEIFGDALDSLALLDPVTRIGTKRYIELALQAKFDEFRRYGANIALIGVRAVDYHEVLKRNGQIEADDALANLSGSIAKSVRSSDIVGRWDKNTLMVIALNAGDENLVQIAERFRRAGNSGNREDTPMTLVVGVTRAGPDDTMASLLERLVSLLDQKTPQ